MLWAEIPRSRRCRINICLYLFLMSLKWRYVFCLKIRRCAPACDSRISFYDEQWQLLDTKDFLQLPVNADFFVAQEVSGRDEALGMVDMMLAEYRFSPDNDVLTVDCTIKDYLPDEIYKQIAPFLKKEALQYYWNGKRYELKN